MVIYQTLHGGFRWRSLDEIAMKRAEQDETESGKGDEKDSVTPSDRDAPSVDELDKKIICEDRIEVV